MTGDLSWAQRAIVVRAVTLAQGAPWLARAEGILDAEDAARAGLFRLEEDRSRFALGRMLIAATLREVTGKFTPPLGLQRTELGRPFLEEPAGLKLSLSHAGEWVCVAISTGGRVGVDVEAVARPIQRESLAKRIFSERDLQAFGQVPTDEANGAFFRAWTGKEAFLKAVGLGLAGGLKEISVPLEWADFSTPSRFGPERPAWLLQALPLPEDHVACVVWDDPGRAVDFRVAQPGWEMDEGPAPQ
jgi:4'-phosphopantetheinyl transferase